MAYVLTVSEKTATGEVARIYTDIRDRLGDLPGVFKLMSAEHFVLRECWRAYPYAMEYGALGKVERELTALAVSRANECRYCSDSATERLQEMGLRGPAIEAIFRADPRTETRHLALMSLAENATQDPEGPLAGSVVAAGEAGLGPQEIREAATVVVWFNLLNRLVDGLGVPHERPERSRSLMSLRVAATGLASRIWRTDSLPVVEAVHEGGAGETAIVILNQILDRLPAVPANVPAPFAEGMCQHPRKITRALVGEMRDAGWQDREIFAVAFQLAGREALRRWDGIVRHLEDPLNLS